MSFAWEVPGNLQAGSSVWIASMCPMTRADRVFRPLGCFRPRSSNVPGGLIKGAVQLTRVGPGFILLHEVYKKLTLLLTLRIQAGRHCSPDTSRKTSPFRNIH